MSDNIPGVNEAASSIWEDYKYAKDHGVDILSPKWTRYDKLYRCLVERGDDSLITDLCMPLLPVNIEAYLPRLVANAPRVEVWGRGPEDEEAAAMHRALIFYYWDVMGMPMFLVEFVKTALIRGTAVARVWWRRTEEERTIRRVERVQEFLPGSVDIPLPGPIEPKFVESVETIRTHNHPMIQVMRLDDFFPHPDFASIDSSPWVIERLSVTMDDLENELDIDGEPLYQNLGALKKAVGDHATGRTDADRSAIERETRSAFTAPIPPNDPNLDQFTLIRRWTDSGVEAMIAEYPEVAPVQDSPNREGSKPFIRLTPIPVANEFYGVSMAEWLWGINKEINMLHAARVDNMMGAVHNMWQIRRGSQINPKQLRFRPQGWVHVGEIGRDIAPLVQKPLDLSINREDAMLQMWAQKLAATNQFMGVQQSESSTATEATIMAQASGSRASLMFKILEFQPLRRLARMLIRMSNLYMDESRAVRIAGSDFTSSSFQKIDPEVLLSAGGVDMDAVIGIAATEPETRRFRLQEATNILQVMSNFLPPTHPILERALAQAASGLGIENPEPLIEQGRQAIQQQQLLGLLQGGGQSRKPRGDGTTGSQLADEASATSGTLPQRRRRAS